LRGTPTNVPQVNVRDFLDVEALEEGSSDDEDSGGECKCSFGKKMFNAIRLNSGSDSC